MTADFLLKVLGGLSLVALLGWASLFFLRRARTGRAGRGRLVMTLGMVMVLLVTLPASAGAIYVGWFLFRPQPANETRELFRGVTYVRDVRTVPRPLVIHVVKVDLTDPGVKFLVTPPVDEKGTLRAQTTTDFLERHGLQVGINGSFFQRLDGGKDSHARRGDVVKVLGMAASNGVMYSPSWTEATLYLPANNKLSFHKTEYAIGQVISGGDLILKEGKLQGGELGENPRSAVGLDESGTTLFMVVVDGKQPGWSEGVSLPELAEILRGMGVWEAINLDGGGSSTLAYAPPPHGKGKLLNSPSSYGLAGYERAVGNHLGVYARPLGEKR